MDTQTLRITEEPGASMQPEQERVKSLLETERANFRTLETAFLHDGKMQDLVPAVCGYNRMMVMEDTESMNSEDPGYIVTLKSDTRKQLINGSTVTLTQNDRKTWQGTLSAETKVRIVSFVRPDLLKDAGNKIINVQDAKGKTFVVSPDEVIQ